MKLTAPTLLALLALAAGAPVHGAQPTPDITAAVADPARPADDRKDDVLREPAATLAFAGVRPGMVVGELFPGGGYYTRMLADIVGPKGKVYGLENAGWTQSVELDRKLVALPAYANVVLDVEPFGITQNYHDLRIAKYGVVDMAAFNRHVFDSLKPGGIYFILDHQAAPGTTDAQIATLHRIEKAKVIAEVTAAGFRLADEGTFLSRPGDDHSKSIFDASIRGHTDQYALKFVKPQAS
jgi:predicted methyltransferase